MKKLDTREEIDFLVRQFYKAVRTDSLIGPIFNEVIGSEENWEKHFDKLTDFWVTNLLNQVAYKGSPIVAHQKADKETGEKIEQNYFDRWMELWYATLDEHFEGDKVHRAKQNAQNIATFMLLKIKMARQTKPIA